MEEYRTVENWFGALLEGSKNKTNINMISKYWQNS